MMGKRNPLRGRENLTGYLFAAPWLIGFFGLTLGPMVVSFVLAFIQWDGISVNTIEWVGLGNYVRAFTEDSDVVRHWAIRPTTAS